jgi:hypothetical protein
MAGVEIPQQPTSEGTKLSAHAGDEDKVPQ